MQRAITYFANQSQATALRFGDKVERVGSGGVESAVLELHPGALGSILTEDRPVASALAFAFGFPPRPGFRLNSGAGG